MWKPRRRVRRIEPLSKMYALQYTPPKATWDCGKCTSEDHLSQRVLRMQAANQAGPEAGRKQLFSGIRSVGGLSRGVWTGPFTGFSTSSTLTLCRDT